MSSEEPSILVDDLESVGSCDSLVRADGDLMEELDIGDMYTNSHVGRCLQTVLSEMLEEGDINIQQCHAIRRRFNVIHEEAYSQCSNKLHLTISGHLEEFNSLPSSATFHIDGCKITGPSSSVQVPRGTIHLAHASSKFS